MSEEPTCGEGLAQHAELSLLVGELMGSVAANLSAHVLGLVSGDESCRHEKHVYEHLSRRLREAEALLHAIGTEMAAAARHADGRPRRSSAVIRRAHRRPGTHDPRRSRTHRASSRSAHRASGDARRHRLRSPWSPETLRAVRRRLGARRRMTSTVSRAHVHQANLSALCGCPRTTGLVPRRRVACRRLDGASRIPPTIAPSGGARLGHVRCGERPRFMSLRRQSLPDGALVECDQEGHRSAQSPMTCSTSLCIAICVPRRSTSPTSKAYRAPTRARRTVRDSKQ